MRRLAIIPARGGSKRIPRKNIRDFLGKPIIVYSIENALSSGLFDEVMVSTDDGEIARFAKSIPGVSVPFMRSSRNADDFATTADVITEVISTYEDQGEFFDVGCCIYPTAPLLKVKNLERSLDLLEAENLSTVFPVVSYGYPIFRSLKLDDQQRVAMNWPEHLDSRSQDLPKAYHDAGQFYWFRVDDFKREKQLFGPNSGAIVLNEMEVQDIDDETDWKLTELKFKILSCV